MMLHCLLRLRQFGVETVELASGKAKLPAKIVGLELGHQLIFRNALLHQSGRARNQGIDFGLKASRSALLIAGPCAGH